MGVLALSGASVVRDCYSVKEREKKSEIRMEEMKMVEFRGLGFLILRTEREEREGLSEVWVGVT